MLQFIRLNWNISFCTLRFCTVFYSCSWGLQLSWWTTCCYLTSEALNRVSQVILPPCHLSNRASPSHWLVEPANNQMNGPMEKITFSWDPAEPLCQRLCCCEQTIFFLSLPIIVVYVKYRRLLAAIFSTKKSLSLKTPQLSLMFNLLV